MPQRRRFDRESANAEAVSHLLRQQERLDTARPGDGGVGSDTVFQGPIEVTYLVASIDARAEIRALADFICSGTDDHVEINVALEEIDEAGGGKLQLSEGEFYIGGEIIGGATNPVWIEGAGQEITIIKGESGVFGVPVSIMVLTADNCKVSDLTLTTELN